MDSIRLESDIVVIPCVFNGLFSKYTRCVSVVGNANTKNFSGCSRTGRAVMQMCLGFIPGESEEGISCELVMCAIPCSDKKQKVCICV